LRSEDLGVSRSPSREVAQAPASGVAQIEVTLVMPCLNEARTIARCIEKARRAVDDLGVVGEIVVADNGSRDGSPEIAQAAGAHVVDASSPPGYGSALITGIEAARGRYLIMGDADDSYDWSAIAPFVHKLREGYDVVLGDRFAGGIAPQAMPALHQRLGNPMLTWIGRRFFKTPTNDIYCGLRGFTKDAINRLDLRSTGMEFALEMVVKATLFDLKIAEVPTTLSPDGRDRKPHLRTWHDGWRSLRFLLMYSPRWLFVYPGLMLMLVGFLLMVAITPAPLDLGFVILDLHTLLYAGLMMIVGFQGISFGLCAKRFAISAGMAPADPFYLNLFDRLRLERGLVVGAVLALAGFLGLAAAVFIWGHQSFGHLDYEETMRVAIPSGTLFVLGCQIILSSFFLGILGLRSR
jgi:glycosyltransferase involved in cell wall biosynthesis